LPFSHDRFIFPDLLPESLYSFYAGNVHHHHNVLYGDRFVGVYCDAGSLMPVSLAFSVVSSIAGSMGAFSIKYGDRP